LLGEGFDAGEPLVAFAAWEEENGGRFFEGGEEWLGPEGPDVGRGDDEGAKGSFGIELAEAGMEGAEKI
jgi:hypothetical protein